MKRASPAAKMRQTLPPSDPSEDFSRRLKISATPAVTLPAAKPAAKLYNPDRDSIPTICGGPEPDRYSEAGSSSYASPKDPPSRQVFDYQNNDPMRSSVNQQHLRSLSQLALN